MTAYLTDDPNAAWPPLIPEISTDDPVLGGPGGPVNAPHQALNNRLLHLKTRLEALEANEGGGDGGGEYNPLAFVDAATRESRSVLRLTRANGQWLDVPLGANTTGGTVWTERYRNPSLTMIDTAFGDGIHVVIAMDASSGDGGWTTRILTSPDGDVWTLETVLPNLQSYSVGFVNGAFFVLGTFSQGGAEGYGAVYRRSAGGVWAPVLGLPENPRGLVFFKGLYVLTNAVSVQTSPDLETWTSRWGVYNVGILSLAHGEDSIVGVGQCETIIASSDALDWTVQRGGVQDSVTPGLRKVTYGDGSYVAIGADGGSRIYVSPGWVKTTVSAPNVNGLTHYNGLFTVVGGSATESTILTAPTPTLWTRQTVEEAAVLRSVSGGNGVLVAVGNTTSPSNGGLILTSKA